MSLGTNGFQVMMGDLVKVITSRWMTIPVGTIAPICGILSGKEKKYQLRGYEGIYVTADGLELVSYSRKVEEPWG